MRKRTHKVVVTFSTTGDAMAMEAVARVGGVPGRMIPVPSAVASGCGLAWCVAASERATLEAILAERGLAHEAIHEVELY